jgi:hypothetical protein
MLLLECKSEGSVGGSDPGVPGRILVFHRSRFPSRRATPVSWPNLTQADRPGMSNSWHRRLSGCDPGVLAKETLPRVR